MIRETNSAGVTVVDGIAADAVTHLPQERITRRRFVRRSAGVAAAGLLSGAAVAPAQTQEESYRLNLFLAVWQNVGGVRIPWTSRRPEDVAESFGYMLNRYIVSHDGWPGTLLKPTGTVVGHATLFAEMVHVRDSHGAESQEYLVFSNTDEKGEKSAGLYVGPWHTKNPYPTSSLVMAVLHLDELLAGHVDHGVWQTLSEYKKRVRESLYDGMPPRVYAWTLSGANAQSTFERLRQVYVATQSKVGYGAPRYFGLNTTEVRMVDEMSNSRNKWSPGRSMTKFAIGSSRHEIHGGCANAVASVLRAIGRGDLVPRAAQISLSLDLERFHNRVLPVLGSSDAFTSSGRNSGRYVELTRGLQNLPEQFGRGTTIRFVDPNYWYDSIRANETQLRHFAQTVESSTKTTESAYGRRVYQGHQCAPYVRCSHGGIPI